METTLYNYDKLLNNFSFNAAKKTAYRGNYGGLFLVMVCVAKGQNTDVLNQPYSFWHPFTRIGKEEYYKALEWFDANGYIKYEKGLGQLKPYIQLNLEEIQVVGYPTYSRPTADPEGYSQPTQIIPRTHDHAPAPARAELVVSNNLVNSNSNSNSRCRIGEPNDDDDTLSLSESEKSSIENEIDAALSSRIPPIQKESDEVLITIAGKGIFRQEVIARITKKFGGRIHDEWRRKYKTLDFDRVLAGFLLDIDAQDLNSNSYLFAKFRYYSEDVVTGKKSLPLTDEELLKQNTPPSPPPPSAHHTVIKSQQYVDEHGQVRYKNPFLIE